MAVNGAVVQVQSKQGACVTTATPQKDQSMGWACLCWHAWLAMVQLCRCKASKGHVWPQPPLRRTTTWAEHACVGMMKLFVVLAVAGAMHLPLKGGKDGKKNAPLTLQGCHHYTRLYTVQEKDKGHVWPQPPLRRTKTWAEHACVGMHGWQWCSCAGAKQARGMCDHSHPSGGPKHGLSMPVLACMAGRCGHATCFVLISCAICYLLCNMLSLVQYVNLHLCSGPFKCTQLTSMIGLHIAFSCDTFSC